MDSDFTSLHLSCPHIPDTLILVTPLDNFSHPVAPTDISYYTQNSSPSTKISNFPLFLEFNFTRKKKKEPANSNNCLDVNSTKFQNLFQKRRLQVLRRKFLSVLVPIQNKNFHFEKSNASHRS